jgi:hypothetical protein
MYAYLPPPLVHAAVLFYWAALQGAARPGVTRRRGARLALAYLPRATYEKLCRASRRRSRALRNSPTLKPRLKSLKRRRKQLRRRRKHLERAAAVRLVRLRGRRTRKNPADERRD